MASEPEVDRATAEQLVACPTGSALTEMLPCSTQGRNEMEGRVISCSVYASRP